MTPVTSRNFGLLVAYVLPGFVLLAGLSLRVEPIRSWLGAAPLEAPTVGGFLYSTLASVMAGMALNTLRWLLIDPIHHHTGVPRPQWDFSRLQRHHAAFETLVDWHFRYAQYYSNSLLAFLLLLPVTNDLAALLHLPATLVAFALLTMAAIFFLASRDALRKYYQRTSDLLARTVPYPERKPYDQRMPSQAGRQHDPL
ncbi:MAG: hypothetical protein HYS13_17610 [Planctomycetia bacterium]|nr:hypothetical protein [Planctomycetia bacterium]